MYGGGERLRHVHRGVEAFPALPWQATPPTTTEPTRERFHVRHVEDYEGDSLTCVFDDVVAANIKEYFPCSRCGVCDYNKGLAPLLVLYGLLLRHF